MNKVAIIIPTKNNFEVLRDCLLSIKEYFKGEYHIFLADTGSEDKCKLKIRELFNKSFNGNRNITYIQYNYYNFAKINNDVVFNHVKNNYEWLLFCNNDIVFYGDFIRHVTNVSIDDTGTIGAKLLFPNKQIQHMGQFMSKKNHEFHVGHIGYGKPNIKSTKKLHEVQGNTFACCLTPTKLFHEIGGLNTRYCECFEDVEYNLECNLRNKLNVCDHTHDHYHYESLSRGKNYCKIMEDYHKNLRPFMTKHWNKLEEIWKKGNLL